MCRTGAILDLDVAAAAAADDDDDDDEDDGRGRSLSVRQRLLGMARTHVRSSVRRLPGRPVYVSVTTSFDTRQHRPLRRR